MLFRNVLRTLQARWIQLVILGIMIFLSSFLYTTMDYAIRGTLEPTESYFEEANQEDFAIELFDLLTEDDAAFIVANCDPGAGMPTGDIPVTLSAVADINPPCYEMLLNRRIETIESTYDNIDLEVRRSKDVYFHQGDTSYRFRVVKDMATINLSYVIEGRRPLQDDELTVSEVFARKNDLSVGDSWWINDTKYSISGFVLFPDYSLTLMGTELIIDNQTQSVVLMTDAAFDALDERTDATIAGVFEGDYTKEQFQEDVIEDFRNQDDLDFISLVVLTENNMRSGAIYAELEGGKGMTILLSLLIASIALMIVGVLVSRILEAQKGPIGIQKAMGYTNAEIARPYLFFLAILSLPIIVLGYVVGLWMAEPFMMIYLDYYVLPYQEIQQVPEVALVAVFLPFVFLLGVGYVIVLRLLRRSPVDLLSPEMTSETSKIGSKLGRLFGRLPVLAKLQQLLLFRNLIKFTVFLMGMFFAAYLIYFTFSMNGIFDRMLYDYYETTEHESIGYCTMGEDCLVPDDGEAVIELPAVVLDGEAASLLAIDPDSSIHPLVNPKGDVITGDLEDGIVISRALSLSRRHQVGDMLELIVGQDTVMVEVVGISDEYTGNKIYASRAFIGDLLLGDETYYNAVYARSALDEANYQVVIDVNDIITQADAMTSFMQAFVLIMVVISIALGAMIIYLLTSMTIEDNFYNISLFKVMGFETKEINRIILGGYLIYGIAIFLLCIPMAIGSFYLMEWFFAWYYDLLFPIDFVWWHAPVALGIFLVLFELGAFHAKHRLERIALQEAMKRYQV